MDKTFYLRVRREGLKVKMEQTDFTDIHGTKFPGIQYRISLDDTYEVSVIKKHGSYGYDEDLWEVALCYKSPYYTLVNIEEDLDLTDDVIGWLNEEEVNDWIDTFYDTYCIKEES